MRVTVLKPDFGVVGGFELLMDRCRAGLEARGHEVSVTTFRAHEAPDTLAGLPLPHQLWHEHPEFFSFAANVERVDALEIPDDVVVVTTQPPTYLLDHPRLVCLTYHQARVFYDLAVPYVDSGYIDADLHATATREVRAIDRSRLSAGASVERRWLAGSAEVAGRLEHYWGVDDAELFSARSQEAPDPDIAATHDPTGPALCVSRHAWPKRTELVVLAAACDPDGRYELVGGGGRQPYVEALARAYAGDPEAAAEADDGVIWKNQGDPDALSSGRTPATGPPPHGLRIHGHQPRDVLIDAYRRAGVVIAPAHREDYGLTVLEAFTFGRPVIVCRDGGGLVELVEGTGAGLVVDPTPRAVADAVRHLRDDPATTAEMARAALGVALDAHRRDDLAVLEAAIEAAGSR